MLCLNGQTFSSRTGKTSGLPKDRIKGLFPSREEWKRSLGPISRGTIIGFFLGLLPGGGPIISSFMSYIVEKKLSRNPNRFGQGAIEGVAAPESANNASAQAAFVPMLTLGIPATPSIAVLLGALLLFGIQPGPLLMKKAPDMFWGLIASMYTGNVLLSHFKFAFDPPVG